MSVLRTLASAPRPVSYIDSGAAIARQTAHARFGLRFADDLEDRLAAANRFATALGVEQSLVLVDSMDDSLEQGYEARPERLYIVKGGKVLWRSGLGPFYYDPDEMKAFLTKYYEQSSV